MEDNFSSRSKEAENIISRIKRDLESLAEIYEDLYKGARKEGNPVLYEYRRMIGVLNGCLRALKDAVRVGRKAYFSHSSFRTRVLDAEARDEKAKRSKSNYPSRLDLNSLPIKKNDSMDD